MKSFKFIPPAILLLLIHVGCNDSKEITVGFLMESFNSARWTSDREHFENRITELKGKSIFKFSDGNDATQYQQAIELIDQGVDVLVIVSVNSNTSASIVREAHKKNIKVIAYDRFIINTELDYFVGFDNEYTGFLQASYALKEKPTGNYILIEGDKSDANAIYIENGQMKVLKESIANGQVKILYKAFAEGWSLTESAHEVEKVIKLTNVNFDAVLCANDRTALGAITKLKEYGLEKDVVTTGLDAELAACQRIYKGEQSMTVYSPIKELATTAANLAMDIASGKKPNYEFSSRYNGRVDVPIIILKPISVDKSNLESTVVKDGVYTKEQVEAVQ